MKRVIVTLVMPATLALGSLGIASTIPGGPAGAAQHARTTMVHTWHGKISKINAKMGTTGSFTIVSGSKTYVVHWDAMTHFTMGNSKNIKVGALASVTGTLKGMTITGTKLDV